MTDMCALIRKQALFSDCCRYRKSVAGPSLPIDNAASGAPASHVLELTLGTWADVVDEEFIRASAARYKLVSLHLDRITTLRSELLGWLVTHVGSKLVELTLTESPHVTWTGHIRKLLERTDVLESVAFNRTGWADDHLVDQLALKFAKTLKHVRLEDAKVTDQAILTLGRKCHNVRTLALVCCPLVTDTSLAEVAKKIHLTELDLSHNVRLTDASVEAVLSASGPFSKLTLVNCPKLGDKTLGALYEADRSWGKKRNLKAQTLTSLVVRDNYNVTTQVLYWLSATAPNLVTLDIRSCPGVDLTQGLAQCHAGCMKALRHLYLGPSNNPVDAPLFTELLQGHLVRLETLHLDAVAGLDDAALAELLSVAAALDEVSLANMPFGTSTVEALCSYVPNLLRVTLEGSDLLRDMDVRCLTQVRFCPAWKCSPSPCRPSHPGTPTPPPPLATAPPHHTQVLHAPHMPPSLPRSRRGCVDRPDGSPRHS